MEFLTENDIKHAALRFLKTHYKYRPRIGDTQARLDNITKSGIIADGLLTFQTDIDNKFEATFEATSYGKAHEVKFKVKENRLWWDSVVFGSVIVTIIFALIYIRAWINIGPNGLLLAVLFLFLSIFFFTMVYRLVFKSYSSYRQIYALEQFKLYDADEQWVAVGMDVFEDPEDKYIRELKRQCILNGFGLVLVDKDHEVRQSITPAQMPLDHKKRKAVSFTALMNENQEKVGLTGKLRNYSDSWSTSLGWEKENRFKYDFRIQLLLILLCGIIMALMLWKESQKTKMDVVDNSEYRDKMKEKIKEMEKEGGFYLMDENELVKYNEKVDEYDMRELKYFDENEVKKWYNKYHQDSLFNLLNKQGLSNEDLVDSLNNILAKKDFTAEKPKEIKSSPVAKKKKGLDPICKEYANWSGKRYILKDGVYKSRKVAEYRVTQINKASAMAGIIRGGCFKETKPYYIVYVDVLYTNKAKADASLSYFDELLKNKGYSSGDLEMVEISVKR